MNWFKFLLGATAVAALVPYKTGSTEEADGEKKVTVESLVYRIEVTPKKTEEDGTTVPGHAHVVVPADGIRKVIAGAKSLAATAKEKATEAGGKIKEFSGKAKVKVTEGAETVKGKVETVVDGVRSKVEDARARRAERKAEAENADETMTEETAPIEVPVTEPAVEEPVAETPKKKRKKRADGQAPESPPQPVTCITMHQYATWSKYTGAIGGMIGNYMKYVEGKQSK